MTGSRSLLGDAAGNESRIELRPSALVALQYSGVGIVASGLLIWFLSRNDETVWAWVLLILTLLATLIALGQLFVPGRFTTVINEWGVRMLFGVEWLAVPWDRIESMEVRTRWGEQYLHLAVVRRIAGAWRRQRQVVVLPIGCDQRPLERFIHAAVDEGTLA